MSDHLTTVGGVDPLLTSSHVLTAVLFLLLGVVLTWAYGAWKSYFGARKLLPGMRRTAWQRTRRAFKVAVVVMGVSVALYLGVSSRDDPAPQAPAGVPTRR